MDNPLNPDKTAAGIVIDPATLDRVVPSSKRKDGTVRKELKIRPGFTPQEDVGRFRSSRQAALAAPTYIPGTTRLRASPSKPENPFAQPKPQTKPKSQAKNEKRREKRALAKLSEKLWDDEDEDDVGTGGLREDFEEVDRERAAASGEVVKVEDPPENEESRVVGDEITNGQIPSGPSQESDDKETQDVGAVSSIAIVTKNLSDDESGASRRMAELELFDIPSDGFQPTDSRIAHESSTTTASESESRLPYSSQNPDASTSKQSTSHVDPGNAKSTMANDNTLEEQHHPDKSKWSTRASTSPDE
ncbi:hypothetical protein TREMEDRAFT_74585 [Tremella mesenterica DSM 1558]|uniref:uncharacterized protein n=1 Tax=Tremella mesenterica (strain ATCC 24925 / CBS 8224 / DSM 1558 / NBRC 9311 / NRRL Y-6157 / RJB 2259-6 / UBC 559-6) TaxID=578456 RepID=UPI0003F4A1E1|nr:uncharacterized protein TREMEDRAFT_74585 [Tremella mesenterica DSM 1558]EIW67441.1 hypothetical protein TREMEDRAFT_74585 [Tremella mesenterica DSM 1558]